MDDPRVDTRPAAPYWRPGDSPPEPARQPGRTGPVVLILVGVLALVALVVVVVTGALGVIGSLGAPDTSVTPPPGGIGEPIEVGQQPSDVEIGDDGAVWTADRGSGTVTRVDPASGDTSTTAVGGQPTALVVGADRVWVWNYSSVLTPIGPDGQAGEPVYLPGDTSSIALDGATLWFSQPATGTVGRLDARAGAPLTPVRTGGRPDQIAVDGTRLVVLDADGTVRSVDTSTGRITNVPRVPAGTSTIAVVEGRLYALGEAGVAELDGRPSALRHGPLSGFDGAGGTTWVLDTVGVLHHLTPDLAPLGETPGLGSGGDVAVGPDGRVWVLDTSAGTVRAVTPG